MSSHEQLVRFAELDGRRVAWAAVGEGPPLVMGGWWMSHLELDWGNRRFRDFVTALARYWTVVRYDRPGTGLSDRDGPPPMTPRRRGRGPCRRRRCGRRRIGRRVRRLGGRADRRAVRGRAPAPGRASRAVRLLSGRRRDRGPRRAGAAAEPDPAALGARLTRPGRRVHPQRDGRRARRVRPPSSATRVRPSSRRGRSRRSTRYNVEDAAGRDPRRRPRSCTEATTGRSRSSSVASSPPASRARRSSPSKAPIISPGTGTRRRRAGRARIRRRRATRGRDSRDRPTPRGPRPTPTCPRARSRSFASSQRASATPRSPSGWCSARTRCIGTSPTSGPSCGSLPARRRSRIAARLGLL